VKNLVLKNKKPVLTVDIVIRKNNGYVFVKRNHEPFKGWWALPGGLVEFGETVEEAAIREAKEETGLNIKILGIVGIYSDPKRDPRGHYVSVTYLAEAVSGSLKPSDETKEVKVFYRKPTKLAFDHEKIFKDAKKIVKKKFIKTLPRLKIG